MSDPHADPASRPAPPQTTLRAGSVGTARIVALVVACAAPVAGVVGLVPLGIALGNGAGMPGAILCVALFVAVFAVGFVRIVPRLRSTAPFYAYISAAFGAPVGVGAAYVLVVSYLAQGCSIVGGFGFFASTLIGTAGASVPWWTMALAAIVASTVLTAAGVSLAGRLLLGVLLAEVLLVLVLDLAVLRDVGWSGLTLESFQPSVVISGSVGVALIYAFCCFVGFEGTAIYSEEAKHPDRDVARATYWVIGIVGLFYSASTWLLVSGAGGSAAAARAAADPGHFAFMVTTTYVGQAWSTILNIMVTMSLFAGMMAFQNAAARYLYALSRSSVLPPRLSQTGPRRGAPVVGLTVVGAVYALVCIAFARLRLDPMLALATSMVGIGTTGIVVLIAVTSLAICAYFWCHGPRSLATILAPLVASGLFAAVAVAGVLNYPSLTGSSSALINSAGLIHLPVATAGFMVALTLTRRRRRAGQDVNRGLAGFDPSAVSAPAVDGAAPQGSPD